MCICIKDNGSNRQPQSPRRDVSNSDSSDGSGPIELMPIIEDVRNIKETPEITKECLARYQKEQYNDEIILLNHINMVRKTFNAELAAQSKLYASFKTK